MNGGSPVEVSSQVVFRSVKGTLGEGDDSTVCTQQQRRRENPSAFSLGFSGFNGFKRHGIKGQLKAVFVEDVGFVIALGHGADFAGRHLLERVPSCWFIFVEGSQTSTRVWDSEHAQWTTLAPEEGPPVRPQDVMILINSRKHLPDLVERLRARNIPVLADRQGLLLMQPVVQPLMAVLGLMARPTMRKAAVELARSPVVGMTEQHVHEVFVSLEDGQAALPHLIQHAPTERVRNLLQRLQQCISWGAVYDVFDLVLDESDLLVAYPEDAQRQFAEAWLTVVQAIGKDTGHDASEMYRRMVAVRNLGNQGPQAITQPTASAVQS